MAGYLKMLGYLDGDVNDINSINNALRRFYLAGITEKYNEDSLYLFDNLGFNKYFFDQNISTKIVDDTEILESVTIIKEKNLSDTKLFEKAIVCNRNFEINNADYSHIVKRQKLKKRIILPFTQSLFAPRHTMIRIVQMVTGKIPVFYRE